MLDEGGVVLSPVISTTCTNLVQHFGPLPRLSTTVISFLRYDCQKLWDAFQLAYVGLDPCKVPAEAYDPFIAAAPLRPACNRVNVHRHVACLGLSERMSSY